MSTRSYIGKRPTLDSTIEYGSTATLTVPRKSWDTCFWTTTKTPVKSTNSLPWVGLVP